MWLTYICVACIVHKEPKIVDCKIQFCFTYIHSFALWTGWYQHYTLQRDTLYLCLEKRFTKFLYMITFCISQNETLERWLYFILYIFYIENQVGGALLFARVHLSTQIPFFSCNYAFFLFSFPLYYLTFTTNLNLSPCIPGICETDLAWNVG